MHKSVLISLFTLFCGIIKAQDYKLLNGKIFHPNLIVAGIHVINADRGLAEITDIDGNFEISVAIGEELIFSGVQYKKRALIITPEIFALEEITVYLEAFINELDEVVVKPHNLSGSLSSDLNNVKEQIIFVDVGIPGYKGVRKEKIVSGKSLILSTLLLPISGGINIDALYKHLSGYYKKLKKRRKLDAQFETVFSIIKFYGVYFFEENYALKQEEVYDFVLGCSENSQLIDYYKKDMHEQVVQAFEEYKIKQYEKD
ncbi:MAG: hypothetical protein VW943_01160 [Flavobacteriaceae bacterium]